MESARVTRLSLSVRLRLLPPELGGRHKPIFDDYRPDWSLGNTWLGAPTINGARVRLDGARSIAPGGEALATLEPLAEEFWGAVDVGMALPMQEGPRIVGYATVVEVRRPEHFTRETAAFVDQAEQFCDFIERAPTLALHERLETARTRLLALYEAGSRLPHVEPPDGFDAGSSRPPAEWAGFEEFEVYWEVFDPYVDEAPVAGSLSDDLRDVYVDVRRGLELWKAEAPRAAAIGEWRSQFDSHWGDHAVDALRALHRACRTASTRRASPDHRAT